VLNSPFEFQVMGFLMILYANQIRFFNKSKIFATLFTVVGLLLVFMGAYGSRF
jgi:hypothetical protein